MKFFIITVLSMFVFSSIATAQPVNICDDAAEWPPYAYWPRVNGKPDKSRVTGAAVDLMKEVFKIVGLEHSVKLYSWKRCLHEVNIFGKNKKFEIFMDAGFSSERVDKYWITAPIYETHKGIFYAPSKYPNGPDVKGLADLKKFKICAVHGNTYSAYKLTSKDMDMGAKTMKDALKKVLKGRCDISIDSIEPVMGFTALGTPTIPKGIVTKTIPGTKGTSFHVYIAKTSPRGLELSAKINRALMILQHNGVSKKIFDKYGIEGIYW